MSGQNHRLAQTIGFPDPDELIPGRRDDVATIRAELRPEYPVAMAQYLRRAAPVRPPHAHRVVVRGRYDTLPVWAECRRANVLVVTGQDHWITASIGVPYPNSAVPGRRCKAPAVRAERH